jgi:hypothetical protein
MWMGWRRCLYLARSHFEIYSVWKADLLGRKKRPQVNFLPLSVQSFFLWQLPPSSRAYSNERASDFEFDPLGY